MKTTVEKLIEQLTDLRVEERDLQKRLEENRQRQAGIIGSLQVRPEATEPARRTVVKSSMSGRFVARRPGLSAALAQTRRPSRRRVATPSAPATTATVTSTPQLDTTRVLKGSGADRVREYIIEADDDAIITTDAVAKELGISPSIVSTALSRVTGKLIERMPGTQRGKFRKINRAA